MTTMTHDAPVADGSAQQAVEGNRNSAAVALAVNGPGAYSFDAVLRRWGSNR